MKGLRDGSRRSFSERVRCTHTHTISRQLAVDRALCVRWFMCVCGVCGGAYR